MDYQIHASDIDVAVNGTATGTPVYCNLMPHTYGYGVLSLNGNDLEGLGITDVREVTVSFTVEQLHDNTIILETDEFTLNLG